MTTYLDDDGARRYAAEPALRRHHRTYEVLDALRDKRPFVTICRMPGAIIDTFYIERDLLSGEADEIVKKWGAAR